MSALDGSGLAFVICAGDLTHGGRAPRYFLHSAGGQLFACDENCAAGTLPTTDTSLVRNVPRWSLSAPS